MDKHNNMELKKKIYIKKKSIKKKKGHNSKKTQSNINNEIKLKQLYIGLIYKHYRDCEIKIIEKECDDMMDTLFTVELNLGNTRYTSSIIRNTTWKKIKKLIDNRLYHNKKEECAICCNQMIKKVDCNGCTNTFCGHCYIDIFKQNKGLIVCPFCRFTTGYKQSDWAIEMGVQMIKNKLGY